MSTIVQAQDPLYIIQHAGMAWSERIWLVNMDPETEQETGPLHLGGKTITGTFTRGDTGAVIAISVGTGITVVSFVGGEILVGLTDVEVNAIPLETQMLLALTVWDADDVPTVYHALAYTVKAG